MERYYIALTELGISNEVLLRIITKYNSDLVISLFHGNTDIFLTSMELLPFKDKFTSQDMVTEALSRADEIIEINKKNKIYTATYSRENYPKNLMRIIDPPAIIYYKGANPNDGFDKAIACIGTRKPTHFGFNAINYLIPQWVNEGFAIISGLATGVDRLSHIACLTNGGKTIAVLAHGLDKVSPVTNRKLAADILSNGGTLLSEYPVGTNAQSYRFINRNRLIVGLSRVTVAMECEEKSGSMHSIVFARKQNCPIFCPDPGKQVEETRSGLKYILDNQIGIKIKSGTDYKGAIQAAGYSINKPQLKTSYIKEQYLKTLLFGIEDENIKKFALEKLELSYHTDFINVYNLFNYLLDSIQTTNCALDNVINVFIERIIATYDHSEKES